MAASAEPLLGESRADALLPWQYVFYANVFMACVSFSIVMPTLYLYLHTMAAHSTFYALVVAVYSIGEAIGSFALGALSVRLGTKRTLQLCAALAFCGATSYGLADLIFKIGWHKLGPLVVLVARLVQGIGSGGQQAVEQAYLSVAAPPHLRTELTSKLSSFACLGFICGPTFAALVSQTPDVSLGYLTLNAYTKQGWFVAILNVIMYTMTTCCFEEVGGKAVRAPSPRAALAPRRPPAASPWRQSEEEEVSSEKVQGKRALAIWACIFIFFAHFNGFAVQETITTPLVEGWFGWGDFEANLLFVGAGVANLGCAVVMSFLSSPNFHEDGTTTQLVGDRTLLVASLALAVVGWLLMVPPDAYNPSPGVPSMGLLQFFTGFVLVTIAFPFGRGLCLSMVGKLLGDTPQGMWMGVMFSLGAIARIAGPFWAVAGFYSFGSLAVFGSTAVLMLLALLTVKLLWHDLEPPPDTPTHKHRESFRSSSPLFHPSQYHPSEPRSPLPSRPLSPMQLPPRAI